MDFFKCFDFKLLFYNKHEQCNLCECLNYYEKMAKQKPTESMEKLFKE
jgi:hypothetical protein